jgi:histidinol phosphatase-like PHP family hydrolase
MALNLHSMDFKMPALSVIDMHIHTKEGSMDGHCSVFESAQKLKEMGFTGMVTADHNSYAGYESLGKRDCIAP